MSVRPAPDARGCSSPAQPSPLGTALLQIHICLLDQSLRPLPPPPPACSLSSCGDSSQPFHDSPVYQLFSWLTLSVTRQTPCGDELFSWCADSCPESLPELPAAVSSARPFSWVSCHLLFPSTFLSTSAERHKTIHTCFPPSGVHRAAWPSFFFITCLSPVAPPEAIFLITFSSSHQLHPAIPEDGLSSHYNKKVDATSYDLPQLPHFLTSF